MSVVVLVLSRIGSVNNIEPVNISENTGINVSVMDADFAAESADSRVPRYCNRRR